MTTSWDINPTTSGSYHIVAIPYPGRGHINPMMNICTLLASKGITITLVLTEEWLGLIGSAPDTPNIRLRTIPNVVPSEHNRAANFVAFVEAVYSKMEAPFDELLDQLELPASCLVADVFLPWITPLGNRRKIPVVLLWTMVPSMFSVFQEMNLSLLATSEDFANEDTTGSFLSTSDEQMLELSKGLQSSGFKFLWVARNEALGLQKDCGEMGLVVTWCDQLRVLCHSSIGGFLTHCGWNSTMEGIFAGIPMITFPLFADQIHNSKLIVEEWKIGVKLKEVEGKENLVGRKEIVKSVNRLMDLSSEESVDLRSRVKDLKESCGKAIEKGGSSDNNINDFIKDFVQDKFGNAK
ncbi:hypothetical protein LguiB_004321 [Lonicera macranthoides]